MHVASTKVWDGHDTEEQATHKTKTPPQSCTVAFDDIEWVVNMGRKDRPPHSAETLQDWSQSLALFLGYEGTVLGAENIRVLWTKTSSAAPGRPRVTEVEVANSTGTRFFEVLLPPQGDGPDAALVHFLSWRVGAGGEDGAAQRKWLALVEPNVFVATHEFLRFLGCFDAEQALGLAALRNRTHTDTGLLVLTQRAADMVGRVPGPTLVRACRRAGVALKDVSVVVSDVPPDVWLGAHASDQIASGLRGPVVYTHVPLPLQLDYFPYYVNFERGRHPRSFVYP